MRHDPLLAELERATAPGRVLGGEFDRVAYASDASMYHLVPRAVVLAADERDVANVLALARRHRVPVTFRAGGTSLSGQGVTDGILIEVARHWKGATVEGGGARIRAKPGMIGGHLNAILAPHGARLGPDPSSLAACTLGGILANNSSGPCSGVEQSAYRTLESLRVVLPDGTVLSTADGDEAFRAKAPTLHAGLLELRRALLDDQALRAKVERKYRTKNTTGYGLNALLDFERPVDILAHLMIGAEGTLGFISEAVLRTVPLLPHTSSAFLLFPSIHAACEAILPFRAAGTPLVELFDEASLRAVAAHPGLPPGLADAPKGCAALLVQAQAATTDALRDAEGAAREATARLSLLTPADFTRDARRQAQLLHARKGLYPAVGGRRPAGTSVLLEDVAFPVERLAEAAVDLQGLFAKHGHGDGIIFGHAKDGNLHFLVTQTVEDRASVDHYARFLDDVVSLVVERHDGALKAEHGTGRNMAPFVEREWGAAGAALMRRIKALFDPAGVLSPGVVLSEGPRTHLDHLKTTPVVAAEVDTCVECGYCESVCPSRDLTLTPRQRIVVLRERARRTAAGDQAGARRLDIEWQYAGLDTCATDGMCEAACPVGIDTGTLVKRLRAEGRPALARIGAGVAARNFGAVEFLGRLGVASARMLGNDIPKAGSPAPLPRRSAAAAAVYFPSCANRLLAGDDRALLLLADRAGLALAVPDGLDGACCGLAFGSKGFPDAAAEARRRTRQILLAASDEGRLPIVVEGSSCTHALASETDLTILDATSFARQHLLPRLKVSRREPSLALHIGCGAQHLGLADDLRALAEAVADQVMVPLSNGCCGFAGDRGFLRPELTASATAPMAAEIGAAGCSAGAGSNLPCQVAMTRATGIEFKSLLTTLEEATR